MQILLHQILLNRQVVTTYHSNIMRLTSYAFLPEVGEINSPRIVRGAFAKQCLNQVTSQLFKDYKPCYQFKYVDGIMYLDIYDNPKAGIDLDFELPESIDIFGNPAHIRFEGVEYFDIEMSDKTFTFDSPSIAKVIPADETLSISEIELGLSRCTTDFLGLLGYDLNVKITSSALFRRSVMLYNNETLAFGGKIYCNVSLPETLCIGEYCHIGYGVLG